jgi:membrane-associated protease RseP (regulator of RpoE activity)
MIETVLYLAGILLMLLGIAFSIGWHELGHLIPAKLFGVRVPQYMVGFGPTVFSKKIGETEYGIKAIPLGGYISMIGMYPARPRLAAAEKKGLIGYFARMIDDARNSLGPIDAEDAKRQFYKLNPIKRMVIMFGGPFMNLVLGFVLLVVVFAGIGVAGPSNKVMGLIDCVPAPTISTELCSATDAPSPAKLSGLQPGDRVISVNERSTPSWSQVRQSITDNPGTLNIVVDRNGSKVALKLTPVVLDSQVVNSKGEVELAAGPFIGVRLATEQLHLGLDQIAPMALENVAGVFGMLGHLPSDLVGISQATVTGEKRDANGPLSIVGISNLAGEVAANTNADFTQKIASGLLILASLNFALFSFNMIPLLPLDGGHIAGAIYEGIKRGIYKLRRKPDPGAVDTALMVPITWVVFILLFAMSAVLIFADLVNPISLTS